MYQQLFKMIFLCAVTQYSLLESNALRKRINLHDKCRSRTAEKSTFVIPQKNPYLLSINKMTYLDTISSAMSMAFVIMFCSGELVLPNYVFYFIPALVKFSMYIVHKFYLYISFFVQGNNIISYASLHRLSWIHVRFNSRISYL